MLTLELVRGFIRLAPEDREADLSHNLYAIRHEFELPSKDIDGAILNFVGSTFDKSQEIPALGLCIKAFERELDGVSIAVVARLQSVSSEAPELKTGAEFQFLLDTYREELLREQLKTVLVETAGILKSGARIKGEEIKGAEAALHYVHSAISSINTQIKRGSIEGSFRSDGAMVKERYQYWRDHQEETVGVLTGIDKLDVAHRGAKYGELILVAGFVSHLKTSFCLNWLYRGAVEFGRNVALASLETPVDVLRTLLYVMHSAHAKFGGEGPLDNEKVTTGSLSPAEEEFFDRVIDDLATCPDYGEIFYKEPEEAMTMSEIQRWAESKHRQAPLDMLVVDYLGLIDPGKGQSSLDSGANLNKTIRQAKMLSLTFANSRGIALVSPFQTNRQGLQEAEKNDGKYKLTALANANEAERSSDIVYYVYLDELLRNSREVLIGNMKTRNGPLLSEPFKAFADPSTRVIGNLDTSSADDLVEI